MKISLGKNQLLYWFIFGINSQCAPKTRKTCTCTLIIFSRQSLCWQRMPAGGETNTICNLNKYCCQFLGQQFFYILQNYIDDDIFSAECSPVRVATGGGEREVSVAFGAHNWADRDRVRRQKISSKAKKAFVNIIKVDFWSICRTNVDQMI